MTLDELISHLQHFSNDYGNSQLKIYDPWMGTERKIARIVLGAFGSVFIDLDVESAEYA